MYINPYRNITGKVMEKHNKANFHIHAGSEGKDSCGIYPIRDVVSLYKQAGYSVLMVSNHDLYSDTSEIAATEDVVMMCGFEYSPDQHILCIDTKTAFSGTHQQVIDKCKEEGGFSVICHPNWKNDNYWPIKSNNGRTGLDDISGFDGIEIYNAGIFRLSGTGLATDKWDYLLSEGRLVWGFGSDDFHRWYDLDRGYNIIVAKKNKKEIRQALKEGRFFVSSGLSVKQFSFADNTLSLEVTFPETYIKEFTYRFIGKGGKVLCEQKTDRGVYKLSGNEDYVRVEAIAEHGARLFTQPIYRHDRVKHT